MELLRHTASLNIPEGLLAQQDPGLMRKLPLLSPLLHPLFIIAFLIKHATTSFPSLPHTLFLRHTPRRPQWKIKSQPTTRCLWHMQKQLPAVKSSALPSGNFPSQGEWAELCSWGGAGGCSAPGSAKERHGPIPELRCWPIPCFVLLCYREICHALRFRLPRKRILHWNL